MEQVLYDRFGKFGLGEYRNKKRPEIGAVHLAAGYILSEMLGCEVIYKDDAAPQVIPAKFETLTTDPAAAFQSPAFRALSTLIERLETTYGYVSGDINWGGILNIALDLRGDSLFMDMFDKPDTVQEFLANIAVVIDRFVKGISAKTKSSSISVNRTVRHLREQVYLHSECSHTMISENDYARFLLPFDIAWSKTLRPYGIHYCGTDPHRYAPFFAKIPQLDFLDVGAGGDIGVLRQHLPQTFFNLRLNPAEIAKMSPNAIREKVTAMIDASADPERTGVCCTNIDQTVTDEQIEAIFQTVADYRAWAKASESTISPLSPRGALES